MTDYWDSQGRNLRESRGLLHNEDYWRFLVREVWRIDRAPVRLVDFGCGYGWAGLFLLPMLAAASDYTGRDRSPALIAEGREAYTRMSYAATLHEGEATSAPLLTTSSTSPSRTRCSCICRSRNGRWPR